MRSLVSLTGPWPVAGKPGEFAQERRILTRLAAMQADVLPVVVFFGDTIKADVRRQFRVGGDPRWAPHALNTIASYKAYGKKPRVLGGLDSRILAGLRVMVLEGARGSYSLDIYAPHPGLIHQRGVNHSWWIHARNAPFLVFPVAAGVRRLKGGRLGITGVAWRREVKVKHPGITARPFVRVTEKMIAGAWRGPLRRYLFGDPAWKRVAA